GGRPYRAAERRRGRGAPARSGSAAGALRRLAHHTPPPHQGRSRVHGHEARASGRHGGERVGVTTPPRPPPVTRCTATRCTSDLVAGPLLRATCNLQRGNALLMTMTSLPLVLDDEPIGIILSVGRQMLRPAKIWAYCWFTDEGGAKRLPACATQLADGMVVQTESHAAVENRRGVLRLLLERYPGDHLVNGGRAQPRNEFEQYVVRYGVVPTP